MRKHQQFFMRQMSSRWIRPWTLRFLCRDSYHRAVHLWSQLWTSHFLWISVDQINTRAIGWQLMWRSSSYSSKIFMVCISYAWNFESCPGRFCPSSSTMRGWENFLRHLKDFTKDRKWTRLQVCVPYNWHAQFQQFKATMPCQAEWELTETVWTDPLVMERPMLGWIYTTNQIIWGVIPTSYLDIISPNSFLALGCDWYWGSTSDCRDWTGSSDAHKDRSL
jgi:hypothetical protein